MISISPNTRNEDVARLLGKSVAVRSDDGVLVGTATYFDLPSVTLADSRVLDDSRDLGELARNGLTDAERSQNVTSWRAVHSATCIAELSPRAIETLAETHVYAADNDGTARLVGARVYDAYDKVSRAIGRLPLPVVLAAAVGVNFGIYIVVSHIENAIYAAIR